MITHDAKIAHLAGVELFSACTRGQLREVAKHTTEVDAPAGVVLCSEGERGRECFVVCDGRATVTIAGDEVATIGPGAIFGELSLLDGEPRVATVTAATDMRLVVISRREFDQLLAKVPVVSRRILQSVGSRLRVADTRLHASHLTA